MTSLLETQRIDRKLSSELTESPINPAFFHMSVPSLNGSDPMFYLQLNGQVLWQWRTLKLNTVSLFDALQNSLPMLGYELSSSSCARIGTALKLRVYCFLKKMGKMTNGDLRRSFMSQFWAKIAISQDEIVKGPQKIIEDLREKESQMIVQNNRLKEELEGNYNC
jgi:hypothetical protein